MVTAQDGEGYTRRMLDEENITWEKENIGGGEDSNISPTD